MTAGCSSCNVSRRPLVQVVMVTSPFLMVTSSTPATATPHVAGVQGCLAVVQHGGRAASRGEAGTVVELPAGCQKFCHPVIHLAVTDLLSGRESAGFDYHAHITYGIKLNIKRKKKKEKIPRQTRGSKLCIILETNKELFSLMR